MARKTRYKQDDFVKVRYRTTVHSGSYIGKVIQYNSERQQYLVAIIGQSLSTGIAPIPFKASVWCRVAELSFATDENITQLKGFDHVTVGTDFVKHRLKNLRSPKITGRTMSKLVLGGYRLGLSVPKDLDKSITTTAYPPVERNQYFRSSI